MYNSQNYLFDRWTSFYLYCSRSMFHMMTHCWGIYATKLSSQCIYLCVPLVQYKFIFSTSPFICPKGATSQSISHPRGHFEKAFLTLAHALLAHTWRCMSNTVYINGWAVRVRHDLLRIKPQSLFLSPNHSLWSFYPLEVTMDPCNNLIPGTTRLVEMPINFGQYHQSITSH